MFTHEEKQEIKEILDAKLKPIKEQLDTIHGQLNTIIQGEMTTVTGIDAVNDEERERSKNSHT